jgi:hypothetical protein
VWSAGDGCLDQSAERLVEAAELSKTEHVCRQILARLMDLNREEWRLAERFGQLYEVGLDDGI